jgi:hypothetical protein
MSERLPRRDLRVVKGFLTVQGRGHDEERALQNALIGTSRPAEGLGLCQNA